MSATGDPLEELQDWAERGRRAQAAAAEGIARAAAHADPDWKAAARSAIRDLATERPELTTDDVWDLLAEREVLSTHDGRALGATMRAAQRAGWIEATDAYEASRRVAAHAGPKRIWRSRLWDLPGKLDREARA